MRGQYFSFDAIVGSIIFVLALITLLSAWHSLRTALEHQSNPLAFEALRIGETLLTPGSPTDAECDRMDSPGVAISWTDRRMDATKLASCVQFAQASPTDFQGKFGTPYQLSIIMEGDLTRAVLGKDVTDPAFPRDSVSEMARVRKIASLYNATLGREELVTMDIYVYR